MAGPGDEIAAGVSGHRRLRASHTDREQAVEMLKAAFVQRRLDRDEFDVRLGHALGARTCADLDAVTADLPAGQDAAHPAEPVRVHGQQPVLRRGRVIGAATVLYVGVWAAVILLPLPAVGILSITSLLYYMIVVLIAMERGSASPREIRSGGRPPRRPASRATGQAARHPLSADPAGQLPRTVHGRQHTAETARSRPPRLRRVSMASPSPGLTSHGIRSDRSSQGRLRERRIRGRESLRVAW
jgi:hypothetical protein